MNDWVYKIMDRLSVLFNRDMEVIKGLDELFKISDHDEVHETSNT